MERRRFLETALRLSATAVFCRRAFPASTSPQERRDLYPEGVASGDPDAESVILWTRRPYPDERASAVLRVQVATDETFGTLVADDAAEISAGRTITAPRATNDRPARFAFVSCQNVNHGAQNAWRRMIFDDEAAAPDQRLDFVLHLGDFVYEIVWYPEDRPQGYYDRTIREVVRYRSGRKIHDFHIPGSLDDYRALYRAYLHDPDLQDARARWPFVPMWDNHEFSWNGWQSFQQFDGENLPRQTLKVAANRAWFEYQPARVANPGSRSPQRFQEPQVVDAPIEHFDEAGLGREPNNLAAIGSLIGYRVLRWGRHLDLVITDQRSYRSEDPVARREAQALVNPDFPGWLPEEVLEILDGGTLRRDEPPQTILGPEQLRWFLDRLRGSSATWKVWGNSLGTLDLRLDPQHLPAGTTKPWHGRGYAGMSLADFGTAYRERSAIFDAVRDGGITGFAIVSGDRHSFWAGLAAKGLPPKAFEPVGVAFVTGSISAPGLVESYEHGLPKDHPLRPCLVADRAGAPAPTINLTLKRGVRASLEYAKSGDLAAARALTDPDLAPHVSFVDMGSHGFATVRVDGRSIESEFVCIPRPVERSPGSDGGPVLYRVRHRAELWKRGEAPRLTQAILQGDPALSV